MSEVMIVQPSRGGRSTHGPRRGIGYNGCCHRESLDCCPGPRPSVCQVVVVVVVRVVVVVVWVVVVVVADAVVVVLVVGVVWVVVVHAAVKC